jgi:hypothetical protein
MMMIIERGEDGGTKGMEINVWIEDLRDWSKRVRMG